MERYDFIDSYDDDDDDDDDDEYKWIVCN